jgi:hypothetical protein
MIRTTALALVLAVVGCKDKKKDEPAPAKTTEPAPAAPAEPTPTTPPPATPPATPAAATLVLGDVKLVAEEGGKKVELALDKTGKVTGEGKQVGEVTTAGELKVDGNVVATIAADGKVSMKGEPAEQITIREDGGLVGKDGTVMLEIADDGTVKGPLTAEMKGKVTISGDKAARRALMLAFVGVDHKD